MYIHLVICARKHREHTQSFKVMYSKAHINLYFGFHIAFCQCIKPYLNIYWRANGLAKDFSYLVAQREIVRGKAIQV